MSDEPVKVCPECGGETRRLIHPVGIVFKGKGFYVTDHRARSCTAVPGDNNKTPKADASAPASETTKPASTSESSDTKAKESTSDD